MMHAGTTLHSREHTPATGNPLFASLDEADVGAVLIDIAGNARYMNEAAKTLLVTPEGSLPRWTGHYVQSLLVSLAVHGQAAERWDTGRLLLRVEATPLQGMGSYALLVITVARSLPDRSLPKRLSRALHLRSREARVLAMLWRGMTDAEIARDLRLRPEQVASCLYYLYEKLGVERRTAAVMRAAAVLAA